MIAIRACFDSAPEMACAGQDYAGANKKKPRIMRGFQVGIHQKGMDIFEQ